MVQVPNNIPSQVFSFVRQNKHNKVFAVFNFSNKPQTVMFAETLYHGQYTNYFTGESVQLIDATQLELTPWDYRVFVK